MTELINTFKQKDFPSLANEIERKDWYPDKTYDGLYIQAKRDDADSVIGWVIVINNGNISPTLLFTDTNMLWLFETIDNAVTFLSDNLPAVFDDVRVCYR